MQKLILFALLLLLSRVDAQCPYFPACPTVTSLFCDYSTNDTLFWNASPHTWSPSLLRSDLPEGELELSIVALDSCGGQNIAVEYTLFLDLDGNDTAETVIRSNAALSGKVLYNNILSPNYSIGDTLEFDHQTGLPDSMKYRFGLELIHFADSVVARLKWTTGIENLNYSAPKLPPGKHRIVWRIEQGGVERFCEYGMEVKDCAPPVVGCVANLDVIIWQNGSITLWASDFLQSVSDNITPQNLLRIGTRKLSANGSGFPTDANGNPVVSVTFDCWEAWVYPIHHLVELWVIDKAGNVDSCKVDVSVVDVIGFCGFDPPIVVACAKNVYTEQIENVSYKVEDTSSLGSLFSFVELSYFSGCTEFAGKSCDGNIKIIPSRNDNPLNGVTTYDLVLISKHIIAIESLDSPYKMIAADANKSGSVTTFDIVELRKLILGIYDSLPDNTSWRFVDDDFLFLNPQNPFQTNLPDTINIDGWNCFHHRADFIGIKVGDVNNTAVPNADAPPPAESRVPNFLALPDLELKGGETYEIPLRATENADWLGLQFSLDFDPELLKIEAIKSSVLPNFDQNNWAQPQAGRLTSSWSAASPIRISPNSELLRLRVKARTDIRLSSAFKTTENPILRSESYDDEGFLYPLNLVFSENNIIETVEVFAPQPNPTRGGVTLPIQLAQTETLRLEILEFSGKLLWANDWNLENGGHALEVPASALPHSGMYIWKLHAGGVSKTGKITKI